MIITKVIKVDNFYSLGMSICLTPQSLQSKGNSLINEEYKVLEFKTNTIMNLLERNIQKKVIELMKIWMNKNLINFPDLN